MNWKETGDRIKKDEGYSGRMYADTEGITTIGYGRNLQAVGISRDEAEMMFSNDLKRAYNTCVRLVPVFPYLDELRQGVLVNMSFNLGGHSLSTFRKFLSALEDRDFDTAAAEMESSKWRTQVGERAVRLIHKMKNSPK